MIGIMRFFVARNFTEFVHKESLERLDDLTAELSNEYQQHNGWQRLKDNPKIWRRLMRSALPHKKFDRFGPPRENDDFRQERPPRAKGRSPVESARHKPPPPPAAFLRRGLSLFDANKQFVAGKYSGYGTANYSLREITSDGQTIGWLGLHRKELVSHPKVGKFLKQQTRAFLLIGGGILLLAAAVALILSKHLLAPINQLTAGTRALASRKFETRIQVRTQDELGQLAQDFNRMADHLKRYEDMRQQWITDISHELRTPIAILKGEIEAMQDGVRNLDRDALESLKTEVAFLNKLVEDLHLLSRADMQSLTNQKNPVAPLEILGNAIDTFRNRLKDQQINLEYTFISEEKIIIAGDADWLTRLFFNLFENTLKYTDSPGKLVIRCDCTDRDLLIIIEDSGPGVPVEALPRLFDRLYRVEKSRSRSLGGSGLGLSICKEIVASHGGEIQAARSTLGGLLIRMTFPLKEYIIKQ